MKILLEVKDGHLHIPSEYNKARIKELIKNGVKLFELKPRYRESKKQRGFYHAAICAVCAYFQENLDHHNPSDLKKVHEWLKIELNGEYVTLNEKSHLIGKSTKGELNDGYIERCIGYMVENYGLNEEVLSTERYKKWRDTIYPHGGPDNYIDYLTNIGLLAKYK